MGPPIPSNPVRWQSNRTQTSNVGSRGRPALPTREGRRRFLEPRIKRCNACCLPQPPYAVLPTSVRRLDRCARVGCSFAPFVTELRTNRSTAAIAGQPRLGRGPIPQLFIGKVIPPLVLLTGRPPNLREDLVYGRGPPAELHGVRRYRRHAKIVPAGCLVSWLGRAALLASKGPALGGGLPALYRVQDALNGVQAGHGRPATPILTRSPLRPVKGRSGTPRRSVSSLALASLDRSLVVASSHSDATKPTGPA